VVHEQEQRFSSRCIDAAGEQNAESISEYVTAAAVQDGLADTLAEPDLDDDSE
jgi:hypothetical protein